MLIQLPGVGRSVDSIVTEAFKALGVEPWGGPSEDGWSKHSDFLRCPYRYYLKHVKGMGPLAVGESGPALDIGAITHLMLAAHYARSLPDARYPGYRENCPAPPVVLRALTEAGLPMQIAAEVERLYDGYAEYYGAETIEPVAVEMSMGLAGVHTSRADMLFFANDGLHDGLWIGEHKTASPQSDLDEYRFDGEVLGLMFSWDLTGGLTDLFGERPLGVCINALVKSKVPRYQRLWLTFPQQLINEYASDRGHWAQQIQTYTERNYWPKSLFGCRSRYSKCRFWEHCRTQDNGKLVQVEQRHARP